MAITSPNPAVVMANFGQLGDLVGTISIILGLAFFLGGFFNLKRYGEMRTMMSHQMTLATPMMKMLAGVMLMTLPVMISTVLNTFWSTSTPLRYSGTQDGWDQYVPVVLTFVRLIGVVSIVRAFVLFSRSGQVGGQPGVIGKALIHLLGGVLAIHVIGTVDLLKNILDV